MSDARFTARIGLFVFAALVAGCGGNVNSVPITPLASPSPAVSPSPTATPTPIPLSISPTSLVFGAASNPSQTLAIMGGAGPYTASGCSGVVTATVSGTTIAVTAVAAGSCTLTISDAVAHTVPVAVTVTTASVPIQ
jgi:hypothetical protein